MDVVALSVFSYGICGVIYSILLGVFRNHVTVLVFPIDIYSDFRVNVQYIVKYFRTA